MSTAEIGTQAKLKLDEVRAALAREITGRQDACLTCSFQAEDVLLAKLAIELDAKIPILFLDTGYHFRETFAYRDRIVNEWQLNLINLLPEKTVAEQEAEHGLLYQSAPDEWCRLRKVEPLFKAVAALLSKNGRCSRCRAENRCSNWHLSPHGPRETSGMPAKNLRFPCCLSMNAATPPSAANHVRRCHSIQTIRALGAGPAARLNAAFTSKQRHPN
jgi:hypothetical protein